LLPNRISVVITERTPYAVWQIDNQFRVISANGEFIKEANVSSFSSLPLIVGEGAEFEASKLLSKLSEGRVFAGKVQSVIRISNRRWNVRFRSGSTLYLPAKNWDQTIAQIQLSPEIIAMLTLPKTIVDARISGQIAIRQRSENSDSSTEMSS